MDCWAVRIDARDTAHAIESREALPPLLATRLRHVEYRMDALRDALYKRYVARDSQLRRLAQLGNSVDDVGERAHAALDAATDTDDWAPLHVRRARAHTHTLKFYSAATTK